MTLCTKLASYCFVCLLSLLLLPVLQANAQCTGNPNVGNTETSSSITSTTATLGGDLTAIGSGGGCVVTERGISWSTVSIADAQLLGGGTSTKVSESGSFSSTGNFTIAVTGLPAGTRIYFVAYAINSFGTAISNGDNFFTLSTTPGQAAGFTFQNVGEDQIDISFAAASTLSPAPSANGGYLVYRSSTATPNPTLTNGSAYSTSAPFRIASNTSATSFSSTGLSAETQYFFAIVPYNWDGSNNETYSYAAPGFPTASRYTLSAGLTEQPNAVLGATASSPTNINLTFPATNNNGVSNDDLYVILRREGSAPDLSTLVDGQAPTSSTYHLYTTTTITETGYADASVLPNKTYFYTIIPFNWNGSNVETINYRTTAGATFPVRTASATTPSSTVTLAGLTTGGSNGLSTDFIGSETDQGVLGFSLTSANGPYTFNGITITLDNDPAGKLAGFELIASTDATLGNGDDISLGTAAASPGAPSTVSWSSLARNHVQSTTYYYFLRADVDVANSTASPFTVSFNQSNVTVADGTVSAASVSRSISADPLATAIGTLNLSTAPNNIAPSPLLGSASGKAIFGFTLTSNISQTVSEVRVRFDADPSLYLQNFALVSSADNNFATANSNVALDATPTVTGTGPYFVTFNPTTDFSTSVTSLNFFVVADVKHDVATTSSAFQASLTSTDITVAPGFASGSATGIDYDLTALTTTIASLNATTAPNNIAASPLVGANVGQAVFGFSLSSNGSQAVSLVRIRFDADPTPFLQNYTLVSSADDDFNTANSNVPLDAAPVITGTGPYFLDLDPVTNFSLNANTVNFFLVADVKLAATTTSSAFQPSLTTADITINQGLKAGAATGVDYNVAALNTTITSLNTVGAPNNISPSPLVGGTTGRGVFGFSASSNGTQSISLIQIRFDSDPTAYLQNFSLVTSADNDFATANSTVTVSPAAAVTGSGPYFLTFDPTVDINISNTTVNFFVVADINPAATLTNSAFQPSLTTADITVTQGSKSGSATGVDYDVDELRATLSSLNTLGNPNNISASPLVGGTQDAGVFGFSIGSNGSQQVTSISIQFDADPSLYLQNLELYTSADNNFATANTLVPLSATPGVTGTGPFTLTFTPTTSINISNTTVNFFVVGDVLANVSTAASVFQASMSTANFTVNTGIKSGTATGVDYGLTQLTATIASQNSSTAPNNLTASPIMGGTADAGIFGFSVTSNGNQSLTQITVRFDADPSLYLQNFTLFNSADNNYATADPFVPLSGTPTVTGTGPFLLTFTPTTPVNVSSGTYYFFISADVLSTVSTGSSLFQPSITTADLTVSQGSKAGSATGIDYGLTQLVTTIASLNAQAAPNNVASSPIVGGSVGNGVFGFSLGSNGSQEITEIRIRFNVDPSLYLENFALVESADANYLTANTPVALGAAATVSGTGPFFLTLNPNVDIDISNTTKNFFLVADVKASVATASNVFTPSLTTADIDVDRGFKSGSALGNSYGLTQLTTTVAQLSSGITASPMAAGTAGSTSANAILGFSLVSNGNQTTTAIAIQTDQNPATRFSSYQLIVSTDNSFATTGDNSVVGTSSINVTGTGPYTITFSPSSALNISSLKNYFIVATVAQSVNTTTLPAITPSLNSTGVTTNQGFVTANNFSGTAYTFVPSSSSTISYVASSTSTAINYANFQSSAALTWGGSPNSVALGTFQINDGAGDADNQSTILTDLTISISNATNLREIAIFDGTTSAALNVSQKTAASSVTFDLLSLTAGDNGTKQFTIRASFNAPVVDKQTHQITITGAIASTSGSNFASSNAGGATTGVSATTNDVVVTADRLRFFETMPIVEDVNSVFTVTARAVDALNSVDIDQTAQVVLSVSGGPGGFTGDSENATQNLVAGVYQWTGLKIDLSGDYTISGNHSTFTGSNDATGTLNIESLGITLTAANINLCTVGSGSNFSTLGNIVLTESDPADFVPGTNLTYLLILPSGYEFRTTGYTPTVSFTASKNITTVSSVSFIGNTIAKFTYSVTGTNQMDVLTISGLQLKNNSATVIGDITRSGTGLVKGTTETLSHGKLTPSNTLSGDIQVASQPGNSAIDPTTSRFGEDDPAVILNGFIGGNPVSVADGIFTGNGVSLKAIGAPVNGNRYIFNPEAVNVGDHLIIMTYKSPSTGCITVISETFRVQTLAIIGLQEQFCSNDAVVKNLSVNASDIPNPYALKDFVYFDPQFDDVLKTLTNSTNLSTTEVKFYANNTFPLTQVALNSTANKTITAITVNPNGLINGVYDYDGFYGYGYKNVAITNPQPNNYIAVYTSFVKLTIPAHGYNVGDRIFINQYVDYVYPYISFSEFTITQVLDVNNVMINIAESFLLAQNRLVTEDYGYSEFYLYSAITSIPVTKSQAFSTYIDFVIPNHGFATGDRISIEGFGSFNPYLNGYRFSVTNLDVNTIRINVQEVHGSGTTQIRGAWDGVSTFGIRMDPYIPLPGYVFDNTQPFPHKGAARGSTTNSQFVPSAFSTNWTLPYVQVYDRIMLSTCGGTVGVGCTPYIYHSVRVNLVAPPIVDFSGLLSDYCNTPGPAIVLTASPAVDVTFSGPGISDNAPAVHQANFNPVGQALETPLTITMTYTSGCTATVTKQVTVRGLPTVDGGPDATICEGTQVTLGPTAAGVPVATGNAPFTYAWDDGGANSFNDPISNEKPKASPIGNTSYSVTVTDKYGCVKTDNVNLTINNKVIADAVAPAEVCGNDANGIPLTSSITGALNTGSWDPSTNGNFYDINGNETNAYPDAVKFIPNIPSGSVTLRLVSSDPSGPCPLDDDQVTIAINQAPGVDAGPSLNFCASEDMAVTAATLQGSATSILWEVQNGTGTIPAGDEIKLQTRYVASANEKIFGATVILKATTNAPSSVCAAATDLVSIQIDRVAAVEAGTDVVKCQDQPIVLSASIPANSSAGSLTWSGGAGSFSDNTSLTPTYTPATSEYGQTINLVVTSNDPAGPCQAQTDFVPVRINVKPEPPITVIPESYCVGALIQPIVAIGNNIKWYSNENLTGFLFNGSSFLTGASANTDKVLKYYATQTSPEGCESLAELDSIVVYPNPTVVFNFTNVCDQDVTQFNTTGSTTVYTSSGLTGDIDKWDWNFGFAGGNAQLTGPSPAGNTSIKYPGLGTYNVSLTATTVHGCATTLNKSLRIGPVPTPEFTYNFICHNDNTEFTSSPGTQVPLNQVATFAWDFGDLTSSLQQNPQHKYAQPSMSTPYRVKLTVTTDLGCVGATERDVAILPLLTNFPYEQGFETGNSGWSTIGFPQDDKYSWKLPVSMASNSNIKNASEGDRAWIVSNGPTGTETRSIYYDNERSALNSPCINVTQLDRPVVAFDYWLNTTESDGVYMQASTDGGLTWTDVGQPGEGINWYNKEDILGLTKLNGVGQESRQFGWAGAENGWKNAKYSLDKFKDQQKLRLRFVFGSNSDNPNVNLDGFGFDNFHLDTRNRVVLVENYTNNSQTINNDNFKAFATALTNTEIIKLQYHTGINGGDEIYAQNSVDPNARAAFYGLTNGTGVIPRVFMDGQSQGAFNPTTAWATTELSTRALAVSPFKLEISSVANADGALEVRTSITPTRDMTSGKPVLFVAVIEKNVGPNGFVVRKLLPSAAGRALPLPIVAKQTIAMDNVVWYVDIDNLDLRDLAIVAFIQDVESESKEVHQAAIEFDLLNPPAAITGIETPLSNYLGVYPNPADREMRIVLPDNITEGASLRMFDQVGKVVSEAKFEKGEHDKTINTSDHAGGVYLIQVETSKGILTRKVMVLHHR